MTGALQFLTGGRRGSFLLAAWAAALILLLQTVAALGNSPHRYSIRLWQIDEGLPNNSVYAVTQTKDGYLWIGTHEGLARFDGVRFVVVDEAVAPELRNGWITALCAASDGSLWAACDGSGVFRLSHGTVVHYTEAEGLPSNKTTCLLETPDGTIWIGTEDGLAHFKNGQFRVYTEKNGLADNSVRDLCLDTNGVLRIATRRGLSGLDKEGRIGTVNFGLGTPMNALKAVCQDHHGNIWVTGNEGVTCVMPDTRVSYTTREGLPDRVATDVVEDRRGLIWVGTYAGLVCIENGKIAAKPLNEHGFGDLVYTIFEDREENLWVGARDGLYRVTPARFTVYTARDGLSSDNVMAVCEDHSGAIWMATWGGGITILRDGKFSYLNTKNGLTHDSVLSLDESHDGSMWVGMDFDGGIDRINHQGKNVFTRPAGFAPAAVRVIHEDAKGTIFVGTSHGLNVIRKGRVNTFTTSRGLAGNTVLAIHETADHAIWIGTDNGLSRWSGGKFTNFTTKQGLSDNTINCIYEDTNHTLWIGTHHGLNRCKEGKFSTYTTTQGLFSDEIYEVVEDDAGSFWMSCRTGLFRVSRQDLEDVAEGRLKAVTSSIYGKSEGLASIQCNGISKPAGWKSRDGRLWFPTIRGVVAVERQAKNTQPPFVVIEEVVADRNTVATSMGEPISSKVALASDHRPLRIRPGHGDLEIQYTALGLRSPEKNRFAYMLQGVDPAWVDAGFRRAAYYNNLAPGHYRFRVKASNNDGVWNETGAAMDIVLLPHFWQTWWFKASIPAAVALMLGVLYRFRVARLREIERLRVQIAADLHDDVGSRLTKVAMVTELVDRETGDSERSKPRIQAIARTTREVIQSMDEIVWTINPKNDTLDNLVNYIFQYSQEYFQNTPVRCRMDFPARVPERPLSTEERHNLFMAVKEALNNALKHSEASEVRIRLVVQDSRLWIQIIDNGKGFDVAAVNGSGNGLENMKGRLAKLGGELRIQSAPGEGSRVEMEAPLR